MAKVVLFVLGMFLFSGKLLAQNPIEKYLAEQELITSQQLKKYYQKKKSDDSYVRMMIKLLKSDKTTRSNALEMEKEYKAEQARDMTNNDTLAI